MAAPSTNDDLLGLMVDAALPAGEKIISVYEGPFESRRKEDGSPVTEADTAAEAIILGKLAAAGLPVLAEEAATAGNIPKLDGRYFVVDPLDGTKEFIKRNGEFTVNIALVEDHRPTLGVVYAPATGQLFTGSPEGAREYAVRDFRPDAGRAIVTQPEGPMHIVASRSHASALLADLWDDLGVKADLSIGSSLKFCLLARGDAQLYPRITPTCEWDTAAGHAVLEAAGGTILTLDGMPLRYGKAAGGYLNPPFAAAANRDLAERVAEHMRAVVKG